MFFLFLLCSFLHAAEKPHPIEFCIPECKIVFDVPEKELPFSPYVPGKPYSYESEAEYYKDYQRSYFAVTTKRGGWDCLRHYEILANGCIPYFVDLEKCDPNTLFVFPRELILEAMSLPGVSYLKIDFEKFDREKYREIAKKLLAYTRKHLTTRAMAQYLLDTIGYRGGKILFLSQDANPDYQRTLLLIGLKELLGEKVVDVPKIDHIYQSYSGDLNQLYGRGMTYTKIVEDLDVDRDAKEFEWAIYGSIHRGAPFYEQVLQRFGPERIVYIDGEDIHPDCIYAGLPNYFLREFEGNAFEERCVTCEFQGQLGNQMFQAAAALSFALDHGCECRLPGLREEGVFSRMDRREAAGSFADYYERDFAEYEPIPDWGTSLRLHGYFPDERYFLRHTETIRKLFAPKPEILEQIEAEYGALMPAVAVHVRTFLPDGIDPAEGIGRTSWNYYIRAMGLFPKETQFLIFSDAMEETKKNFPRIREKLHFVEGNSPVFDLYLMSRCAHQIVAPKSTFSWWAAWLNPNPEKMILVPDGMGWSGKDHCYPPTWIRILAR